MILKNMANKPNYIEHKMSFSKWLTYDWGYLALLGLLVGIVVRIIDVFGVR